MSGSKYTRLGGLILPRGWFGKPGDNYFELTYLEDRPIKTILELMGKSLLIFTGPCDVWVDNSTNQLVFARFTQVIFDFEDPSYGAGSPAFEVYKVKVEARF